ncbi:hypothetical protein ACHAXN_003025 [Cyclotella atomus]
MAEALSGVDISKIMSEEGTLVKCVVLRCRPSSTATATNADSTSHHTNTAGGSTSNKDITQMSIKEMKAELKSFGVNETFVEKDELMKALEGERAKLCGTSAHEEEDAKLSHKPAEEDAQPSNSSSLPAAEAATDQVPLSHLIEEITIDTTPRKFEVAKVIGGDFTFLGQYEDEGIMVMVRRPTWEHDADNNSGEEDEGGSNDDVPPINPHKLHPPLNDVLVRGDILLMRVAETKEELDDDQENDEQSAQQDDKAKEQDNTLHEAKKLHVPSSDEFFLDYTKDEYLRFAARTDVTWEQPDEEESEEDEDESNTAAYHYLQNNTVEGSDEDDAPYDPSEQDDEEEYDDTEEHQIGMMNLILGQILRKFHEENGRGPNTLELLDMRKALADKLGVDVPEVDEEACDWDKKVDTPRKHGRRVVVVEGMNECETITVDGSEKVESCLKRSKEVMENGTSDCSVEQSIDNEECRLKKPPEDTVNSVHQSDDGSMMNKKQKLEEDSGGS